ncbi:hypothetical protein [Chenggangzhangella methanolivorans]|uniref:Uncharacterized protein n=1 Tax=Chenggangzhangella methanolivorans TaxID=1437009 RepID=A0A9E6UN00_9HYPH|nr:hypothetical protein [Chenggangzhangella methanolivorans]QZO00526.1 hypothetical protein K6K41_01990 [Chenggangzhangella methanolivorans]
MAAGLFGEPALACNPESLTFLHHSVHGSDGVAPNGSAWLTPVTRRLLLEILQHDGFATLEALIAAIPVHPRPLSAVVALIDEGLASFVSGQDFSPDAHVVLRSFEP